MEVFVVLGGFFQEKNKAKQSQSARALDADEESADKSKPNLFSPQIYSGG
jgi:hypothetical protein